MEVNEILEAAREKGGPRFKVEKSVFITAEGKPVGEGDTSARYVLAGPGGDLPADLAKKIGLDKLAEDKTEDEPKAEKSEEQKPVSKMVQPAENKAVSMGRASEPKK